MLPAYNGIVSNFDCDHRRDPRGYDPVGHIVNLTFDRAPIPAGAQRVVIEPQPYLSINMTYGAYEGDLRKEKGAEEPES